MKTISSTKHAVSQRTADEEALFRCDAALERKDRGDLEGAQKAIRPIWRMGQRPKITGLDHAVSAEVLLTAGILAGWFGSKGEISSAQEEAKNLITESITYYESVGDKQKIAAARTEIAHCYWREGALNEARVLLLEALQELTAEGNTRARALLKLTIVELSASRVDVALEILQSNASLFEKVTRHTIKGTYHNELALLLRRFAHTEPAKKHDHLQQALREFEKADYHFGLAENNIFRAAVKNNVGLVLFDLSQFKQAHKYLLESQRLALSLKDKVRAAEIGETRAQVFIAENNLMEAETVVRQCIQVLEKSDQQTALPEALTTHGIALARLKQTERSQFTFETAIEVATQAGALNQAGLAALTMIEELDDLSRPNLQYSFQRASEGLAQSLNQELIVRLNAAAGKVYAALNRELNAEAPVEAISGPCNFQEEVLKFEGTLIRRALAQANGSVTRAASMLSLSYQALAYIIGGRHKDLLKERSPIRRRRSQKKEMHSRQLR